MMQNNLFLKTLRICGCCLVVSFSILGYPGLYEDKDFRIYAYALVWMAEGCNRAFGYISMTTNHVSLARLSQGFEKPDHALSLGNLIGRVETLNWGANFA